MEILVGFFTNRVVIATLLSWLTAQIIKFVLVLISNRTLDTSRLFGSGGMPSSHSSLVSTLVIMVGRVDGVETSTFALAFALAIIVMYDATNVRREAGEHARIINILIDEWVEKENLQLDRNLKELLGHTPFEVIIGAILGILIGCFFPI